MPHRSASVLVALSLVLGGAAPLAAQPPAAAPPADKPPAGEKPPPKPAPEERTSKTRHTARIGGQEVRYTATAGTLVLKAEDGTPQASIFHISYTRDGEDPARRPVTFTFNGGPGSSSVWLHLGAFGPKRVQMDAEGRALPPPYRLVDNEHSLLDVSDLVFIDPVSTGYSRPAPGKEAAEFHGVTEDVRSVAEFIRLWTTRNGRWASPKLLAGESYGTTRAAGLALHLQETHGMYLNGIALVSSILMFQTARFDVGNDLPYLLFLPTYTATAWYHKRLPAELQGDLKATLEEAERFALGDYAQALLQGNDLPEERRRAVAAQLARLTGLSPAYVEQVNLRPVIHPFTKELLRGQGLTVGRLDSRFTGVDRQPAGDEPEFDPSMAAIEGPYTATFNDYVRRELRFEEDLRYRILEGIRDWKPRDPGEYLNVAEDLRRAMAINPALRVFVASGYYDLATPYFATEYTLDHIGFEPAYEERTEVHEYEAGHMMYIRLADLAKLKSDLAGFLRRAVAGASE
ncbi:MAG TPA: peptidase S10 [Thermoanaerobaculia bacterium]|nr:peptidase S10 [Thermoanaerobaculia bacterium]